MQSSDVLVVVITPPLPRNRVTARTAIQAHAVNLIEIRLGKNGSSFEPVMSNWKPQHQQGGLPLVGTQESSFTTCWVSNFTIVTR